MYSRNVLERIEKTSMQLRTLGEF